MLARVSRNSSLARTAAIRGARPFSCTAPARLRIDSTTPDSITLSDFASSSTPTTFPALFLRDACPTAGARGSVDPFSSQKTFSTGELSTAATTVADAALVDTLAPATPAEQELLPLHAQALRGHDPHAHRVLRVCWADGHTSLFPERFLERYAGGARSTQAFREVNRPHVSWDALAQQGKLTAEQIPRVDYFSYMYHDFDVYKAVRGLHDYGLVFVDQVPQQEDVVEVAIGTGAATPMPAMAMAGGAAATPGTTFDIAAGATVLVEEIGKRVGGYIKDTFYGRSWNVISVPAAKNVAYTSVFLPLHMDLCYYESPPGVQLLHVIRNSTVGGESLFADSHAAAHHVYKTDREAYEALKTIPLTFHYDNDGEHYYKQRPMVVEDPYAPPATTPDALPALTAVNYSPPFQGPLDALVSGRHAPAEIAAFHRGIALFEAYINDKANQLEIKMEENTCMLFLNRRILHARNEFDQMSGTRWFRGTYLDIDAYQSKLRTALRRYQK